jgi:hypothetical protein
MLKLTIDMLGTEPGCAFLYDDSPDPDPRIDGRFGRTNDDVVYLESYSSWDLVRPGEQWEGEPFDAIYVEASSRKAAIVKLLRQLGYPRGTKFKIKYEKD